MINKYYQKTTKKKHMRDIKIFMKKKKTKGEKRFEIAIKISLKKKQKLREYMKKYYLAHKK